MQGVFKHAIAGKSIFRSEEDWNAYSKGWTAENAKSATTEHVTAKEGQIGSSVLRSQPQFLASIADGWVWMDVSLCRHCRPTGLPADRVTVVRLLCRAVHFDPAGNLLQERDRGVGCARRPEARDRRDPKLCAACHKLLGLRTVGCYARRCAPRVQL